MQIRGISEFDQIYVTILLVGDLNIVEDLVDPTKLHARKANVSQFKLLAC